MFLNEDGLTAVIDTKAVSDAGFEPFENGLPKTVGAFILDVAASGKADHLFQPTLPHGGAGSTQPAGNLADG